MPKPDAFQDDGNQDCEMEEVKGDQVNHVKQNNGPIFDVKKFYANIISYDED